jgi:hypothetical protein
MKTNEQLKAENKAIRDMLATGPGEELLAIPGVVHVSVGLKQKGGKITDQLCIRVYVKEKKDEENIPPDERIPPEINGVPTDVNIIRQFEFSLDFTRYRPIKGGIQVTNRIIGLNNAGDGTQMPVGTMGCAAIDKTDDAPVLLSNWHVLYGNFGRNGDKVYQPAPSTLQPVDIADLPYRPRDDNDKIAVLRRNAISEKVDGAIAAIDVSSCCRCCGIHYSNEINGLSVIVNGQPRPPRNTIVGDEAAVSGMTVFKVGQSTLRTEGVVVDDNYPSFDITKDGTTYTFTGQIHIENINNTLPFSDHGDSGSVIINLSNKIVGLLFASGIPPAGSGLPFLSLANHISDVLSELNIRIPYSQDVEVIAGETLTDVPSAVLEAPVPEPYRALRERLESKEVTAKLFALGQRHSEEIAYLVNHCRPVTVAWHRSHGPALLATVMCAVRDGHYKLPATVKGVAPFEVLERMRDALSQHGSAALREMIASAEIDLEELFGDCDDLNDLIERIAADKRVASMLEGMTR